MRRFFTQPPQTPGEAFLRGFKYVDKAGNRNNLPGYNLIKHNKELSDYILEKTKNIISTCNSLINAENSVTDFLEQLSTIINDVQTERVRQGKVVLKNVHKNQLLHEDEASFMPIKTADIYREPYKRGEFEKYIIAGLKELKKFIMKEYNGNLFLINRCDMCIADIHNYRPQIECVAYGFEIFKNTNITEQIAAAGKEHPVTTLPNFAPK